MRVCGRCGAWIEQTTGTGSPHFCTGTLPDEPGDDLKYLRAELTHAKAQLEGVKAVIELIQLLTKAVK